jgi:isoleucyl-tRNA synthetase
MADEKKAQETSFKYTLNLPKTDFPIRSNAAENDPKMIERWEREQLFEKSFSHNMGAEKYILHDGPPYANGNIHVGHAYNKILKDIIGKSQRMSGKQVPITPGWDCHGLPIELSVSKENPNASKKELKEKCRAYAQKWIDVQRTSFKELGVLMDWDRPYLTMNYDYEAKILRALGEFVGQGYIERKNKTVPWCPSCQTVLASAEIEYKERKDPSVYVYFPLDVKTVQQLFPDLVGHDINLLVWTTTPWTLPLNRAVCLKPGAQYQLLECNGSYLIVGEALADKVVNLVGAEKNVISTFKSEALAGARAHHPFVKDLTVPVLLEQFVGLEDGTACVHSAPGVGPEDYEIGVRNKLEIYSPISPAGTYTHDIQPKELEGMSIADGQGWVIKTLIDNDKLFYKESIKHSYPHCWRCRGALIFRATPQWFINLEHNNLKERALTALQTINFLPERSINFLHATIESRFEWVISRQRIWGVPIPALLCKACDYSFITQEMVNSVADGVYQEGISYWDSVDIKKIVTEDLDCPKCGSKEFEKEDDILDVWFDSGVSHYAVLWDNPELAYPANVYVEGVDQHRGWFQSSLLTSLVIEGTPQTKSYVTHGFTVDAKGQKMSKSVGNVVTPKEMIKELGTDGLRLWASSINIEGDAVVSPALIQNINNVLRKIRNTCRFLLSNLYDFDIDNDAVPFEQMLLLDQYALEQLSLLSNKIRASYEAAQFTGVYHDLADYCAVELSAFYLDIIKDRLYTDLKDGNSRRSAQTACWYIVDSLSKLMAPILSFTAESVSDHYQRDKQQSIHLQDFADLTHFYRSITKKEGGFLGLKSHASGLHAHFIKNDWDGDRRQSQEDYALAAWYARWDLLKEIRSVVLKALEQLRSQGIIKHSLEANLQLTINTRAEQMAPLGDFFNELKATGQTPEAFFKQFFIVSACIIEQEDDEDVIIEEEENEGEEEGGEGLEFIEIPGLEVQASKADGIKCPRCWQWEVTDHAHGLCARCQMVLSKIDAAA